MSEPLRLRLEGIGWLAAWRLARALPERWVMAAFERLGERSYRRNARRRAIVRANLEPVVGPARAEDAAREAFRWYGRYWAETFRMQDMNDEELNRRIACDGCENIAAAYGAGSGVVLATPHLGNWDAGGRWVASQWPLTVVVEVLRPRMLFDRFVARRRAHGMTIVPLERGGDVTARCMEHLAKGELVALVCDRDLSGGGVEVKLFGRRTSMPVGPAVLALRSGAPLIAGTIYQRKDGTWRVWVLPPLERPDAEQPDAVPVLTQRLAEAFETLIAEAPSQWHVFNRYWLDG